MVKQTEWLIASGIWTQAAGIGLLVIGRDFNIWLDGVYHFRRQINADGTAVCSHLPRRQNQIHPHPAA